MIAALMEYTNYLAKARDEGIISDAAWNQAIDTLLLLLAPTAPHLAEELWQQTGHDYSIHNRNWPDWNEEIAKDEEITLVVQVNGKLRDRIMVSASITEDEALWLATESHKVKVYLKDKDIVKKVYIQGRLVNLVVK
ncbi:Leucine--tRNA ligase [subsurface metagenome]